MNRIIRRTSIVAASHRFSTRTPIRSYARSYASTTPSADFEGFMPGIAVGVFSTIAVHFAYKIYCMEKERKASEMKYMIMREVQQAVERRNK